MTIFGLSLWEWSVLVGWMPAFLYLANVAAAFWVNLGYFLASLAKERGE